MMRSVEKTISGWHLGVHIADVAAYVEPGTRWIAKRAGAANTFICPTGV